MSKILKCPNSKESLQKYIHKVFGYKIPDKKVCKNHCTPMDAMYKIFFEKVKSAVLIGSRGSGKTQNMAIMHVLNSIFKRGCETATVGAIENQAIKCYSYFKRFIEPFDKIGLVRESQMKKTLFSPPINSKVEVLTGTINGVNSPHPQKSWFDEFDLTTWPIFQEWLSMSMEFNGVRAQNILASTRKKAFGPMERVLRERHEMRYKVFIWCIWEVVERCKLTSCEKCKRIIKGKNKDGSPRSFYDVCGEKAKISDGFYKIRDLWDKFSTTDVDTWSSQYECKNPMRTGQVFYWFDPTVHCSKFEIDLTNQNCVVYESIDWGGSDPNVYQLWVEKAGIFILYDEIYIRNTAVSTFAKMIKDKRQEHNLYTRSGNCIVNSTFCDRSSKLSRLEMSKAGIDTIAANNDIPEGIKVINILGEDDKIHMHSRCKKSEADFQSYSWPVNGGDRPNKANSHAPDAARYFFLERNPLNILFDEYHDVPEVESGGGSDEYDFREMIQKPGGIRMMAPISNSEYADDIISFSECSDLKNIDIMLKGGF